MRIDINRFIAKYDFDVARKICPVSKGVNLRAELQNTFKMTALMEVLQHCSNYLSKGQKYFQSIYTLDGTFIRDLDEIPSDAQILIVSENSPPMNQQNRLRITQDFDKKSID